MREIVSRHLVLALLAVSIFLASLLWTAVYADSDFARGYATAVFVMSVLLFAQGFVDGWRRGTRQDP